MESKENVVKGEDVAVGETRDGAVKNNCDNEKCDNELNNNKSKNLNETVVEESNEGKMDTEKDFPKENSTDPPKAETKEVDGKPIEGSDRNGIIVVQKPKRTKSRRSLNKMPTMNNINVDVNGNATLYRSDR